MQDHETKQADPLTIAYIAMGAHNALNDGGGAITAQHADALADHFGGQLGIIGAAIEFATMLDELADAEELSGVFVYEVAEPFGAEIVQHLREHDVQTTARTIARNLIRACAE